MLIKIINSVILLSGLILNSYAAENRPCRQPEYNVVIIAINALRLDHLGCYGYSRNTSPCIDNLGRQGILFDRAISQSYWTLPSITSLFTSKYVCAHNLNSRDQRLNANQKTLADILKCYGYSTKAFTCGLDTAAIYGLNKGFDVYDVYDGDKPVGSLFDIIPKIIDSLRNSRDKKFFLFLHSYDIHPPYKYIRENSFDKDYQGIFKDISLDYNTFRKLKDGAFNLGDRLVYIGDKDIRHIIACYDDGLRRIDGLVGVIINELKTLKLYDRTIIILFADHGEELGERGTFNRFGNQNLYQEVIRVPLIIRYPGLAPQLKGRRIKSLVGLVDIVPTILDLLGIPQKEYDLQGVSLAPILKTGRSGQVHKFMISEASREKWTMLRQDGWKLIHSSKENELYNLNIDPYEGTNIIKQEIEKWTLMTQDLFFWREHHRQENDLNNRIDPDPRLIERLRKAGYW